MFPRKPLPCPSPRAPAGVRPPAPQPPCSARCSERGCVFPACFADSGLCLYHQRFRNEPQCFRSCQPTLLVVEQAPFCAEAQEVTALASLSTAAWGEDGRW